jgi:hypothetical protein
MPLFPGSPDQNDAVWEPQAADSRLARTAGADPSGVFTSDLSVSEYVLLGEAGFEPLGFVVGSSIAAGAGRQPPCRARPVKSYACG